MAKKFLSSTKFVVKINPRILMKDLVVKNDRAMTMLVRGAMEPIVEKASAKMSKAFEAHPVTQEINSGPLASNLSGTLGGKGTLFSFIGFDSSDRPTQVISEILKRKVGIKVNRVGDAGRYKFSLEAPSLEEIYKETPIPWLSQSSWAEGIEKGISGLGFYLFKPNGAAFSSSGTGLQSKTRVSSVSFSTTPYLEALLKNFQKDLTKSS